MREMHLEERPTTFKQVVGQTEACQQLVALGKSDEGIPHTLLFTGPSGCGKTTMLRCLANSLARPDEAENLAKEVCMAGNLSPNAMTYNLLAETRFRAFQRMYRNGSEAATQARAMLLAG